MNLRGVAGLAVLLGACLPVTAGGEIWGTVHTVAGQTLTGPIRWDQNENFWDDVLDATKPRQRIEREERGFELSLFGIKIGGDGNYVTRGFSIPFGHLRSIEPLDNGSTRLTLKNGERIEVQSGGSDLGGGLRGVVITDRERGAVDLGWNQLRRVEFAAGPGPGRDRERLFGTVETSAGNFTGFIVWDRDESLAGDVLDGNDSDGVEREIPFARIRSIERLDRGGSRVRLTDGETLVLDGTNDVDRGHRGVAVTVTGLGTVEIDWRDVRTVRFDTPPPSPAYSSFDGGRRLSGTVQTRDERTLSGEIVWDLDETHSWETLDGSRDGIDYAIPFALVREVEPLGRGGSKVRLVDERILELTGSNDVNAENKGLIVRSADAAEIRLDWADVIRVVFR